MGVVLGVVAAVFAFVGATLGDVSVIDGEDASVLMPAEGDLLFGLPCPDTRRGVDITRMRGVVGAVLSPVSESDVNIDTDVDRTVRREGATEGTGFALAGTLFCRAGGALRDLLIEEEDWPSQT